MLICLTHGGPLFCKFFSSEVEEHTLEGQPSKSWFALLPSPLQVEAWGSTLICVLWVLDFGQPGIEEAGWKLPIPKSPASDLPVRGTCTRFGKLRAEPMCFGGSRNTCVHTDEIQGTFVPTSVTFRGGFPVLNFPALPTVLQPARSNTWKKSLPVH